MKSWVKLYTEITRDPKIGSLSWAERGIWSALLALAGEMDVRDEGDRETGEVDTVPNISWRIRCDEEELRAALGAFEARDMISLVDGPGGDPVVMVTHYGERQRRPESDRHAAVLERVKRHREVRRAERNVVTVETPLVTDECNEVVTPLHGECNEVVTPLESESDTDSEAEESATAAPSARAGQAQDEAVKEKSGPGAPRSGSERDARSREPAVLLVKAITGRMPPKGLYESVIQALAPPVDEERLRRCYQAWLMRGYKVTNFAWLFEWYAKKGIPEERRNGDGKSRVEEQVDRTAQAIRDRMALVQARKGAVHGE
jgi:hypothetical protein